MYQLQTHQGKEFCDKALKRDPAFLHDDQVANNVRSDRRCGPEFPLDDGTPSQCDGNSANHCCSKHGYCGPGPDHCDCIGCVDYRGEVPKGGAFFEKDLI